MMRIDAGNRDKWEFEYTCSDLANGARKQREFRLGRVAWWKEAKEKVMAEIKDSGIEVSESLAANFSNYSTKAMHGPQVMVRADLQTKLSECHEKIQAHQQAADDYDGWANVLDANPAARVKLTQADWQYFFGKAG